MTEGDINNGKVGTWKHLNDEVRIKGLTGPQLAVGILIFLVSFTMTSISLWIVPVIVLAEAGLYYWLRDLQKDGDMNPMITSNVKNGCAQFIQDKTGFYERLLHTED